eukprot:scaffold6455_cov77-Cylindrotheca_fusiformis.AAC.2
MSNFTWDGTHQLIKAQIQVPQTFEVSNLGRQRPMHFAIVNFQSSDTTILVTIYIAPITMRRDGQPVIIKFGQRISSNRIIESGQREAFEQLRCIVVNGQTASIAVRKPFKGTILRSCLIEIGDINTGHDNCSQQVNVRQWLTAIIAKGNNSSND